MNGAVVSLSATLFAFFTAAYFYWEASQTKRAQKRASRWFEAEGEQKRKSFIYLFGDKYDESELSSSLKEKLAHANLSMKASEYGAICILIFAALWFVNRFLLQLLFPLDLVMAYLLVWGGSKIFLNSRKNKRSNDFNKQLPEVCRMMSNTVKAGMTLHQGISIVAKELPAPAGSEFQELNQELNLGGNFDEVVNGLTEKVASEELKIFVNTISIQRRVGGNLAEVLGIMAGTLEERERVNKEINTLTAEAKTIAIMLPTLPILMAMMMNLVIPGFLNPLFTPLGLILIAVFAVLQLVAFAIIRKITRIRV
ncbi:type II secretion system F family protein [Alteribacter aurantiacus]|uniref:type II secretion system F family protein n=1 Tax=Alteribacter aurantiacus TaxID=254410 RepID=UPI000420AA54|nr:type II secretion system F family protein [Alteribacter aurantiacus]